MNNLITKNYLDYEITFDTNLIPHNEYKIVKKIISLLLSDTDLNSLEVVNKHSRKNIDVYKFTASDFNESYYVKHFYMKRWEYYLKDLLIEPIGLGAYKKSLELIKYGVPAAEPVAAVTYKSSSLKRDSILINREVKNNLPLSEYLSDKNLSLISNNQLSTLFKELGLIFGRMLNNNYIHTDTNLKNFLVQHNGNLKDYEYTQKIFLIDIDDIFNLSPLPLPEFIKISIVAGFLARIRERLVKCNFKFTDNIFDSFYNGFLNIYSSKKDDEYIKLKIKKIAESKFQKRK